MEDHAKFSDTRGDRDDFLTMRACQTVGMKMALVCVVSKMSKKKSQNVNKSNVKTKSGYESERSKTHWVVVDWRQYQII